jgi:hypothetical protein
LEVSEVRPETRIGESDRVQYAAYVLALAVCVSTWFVAIRAPLWLDETVSFFLIKGGFAGIMSRQVWPDAPAYSYLLWLWTKAIGTAEITLRISSILPRWARCTFSTARQGGCSSGISPSSLRSSFAFIRLLFSPPSTFALCVCGLGNQLSILARGSGFHFAGDISCTGRRETERLAPFER